MELRINLKKLSKNVINITKWSVYTKKISAKYSYFIKTSKN